jgi:hypothetical protein
MPPEFAIGADFSDDVTFIALVLGYKPDILRLHNKVCEECKLKHIHMRKTIEKSQVIGTMNKYSTSSVHMFCFVVDRPKHMKTLDSTPKTKYLSGTQKNDNIDYCIVTEMKNAISSSLELFYQNWSDIMVEADQDTKKMFKVIGRPVVTPDSAYELVDAVAWANHARSHISQVREMDMISDIDSRLRKKLKL